MVTVVPTGPLEGLNPEIIGWAKAQTGVILISRSTAVKIIRLQFAELRGLMVKIIRLCVRGRGYNLYRCLADIERRMKCGQMYI
jgi:hypothetical protein